MAPPILIGEPTQLRAGDTWTWQRAFGDYPISEGWSLSYQLTGPSKLVIDGAQITNDGTTFTVVVPATTTTAVQPGSYEMVAILAGSGDYAGRRDSVRVGRLPVTPDPATLGAGDLTTHAERMLAAVEAAIEALTTGGVKSYMLGPRQVVKNDLSELQNLRRIYAAEVKRHRSPTTFGRRVQWRAVPTS